MAKTKLRHLPRRRQESENRRGGAVSAVRSRARNAHARLGASPAILWFLGGLVLLLWLAGTVTQIQTSEYLAQGATGQVSGVAWGVLVQPWLMVSGQAPIGAATSWEYGWTVEVLTLVLALAVVAAYLKIYAMNPLLARCFIVLAVILLVLNSWADFQSSPGSSTLVRILVAVTIGLIVTAGLPLGVGLIEHGIEEYQD